MRSEAERQLTYDDLLQIVDLIKSSERFSEFRLKVGEIEIELRRRRIGDAPVGKDATATTPAAAPAPTGNLPTAGVPAGGSSAERGPAGDRPAARSPAAVSDTDNGAIHADVDRPFDEASLPRGAIVLRAPTVGTFYRSPAPGAPPFVCEGQIVAPDTTVCIIEVMKLMNSIPAGEHGTVRRILVADAAAVDAGTPLIVLDTQ